MGFSTYFSKQARKPAGFFGRFISARIFEKGNAELNVFVRQTVAMRKNEYALEIGFGTGLLMKQIADGLESGCVEGVDFSETMVALARRKNRKHAASGKVKIHSGDFIDLPFPEDRFDKIYTVNTLYFWKHPEAVVARIRRLLKPGGKVVIGCHAKDEMEKKNLNRDIFRYYSPDDMVRLLQTDGGLKAVEVISREAKGMTCYCAVGIK